MPPPSGPSDYEGIIGIEEPVTDQVENLIPLELTPEEMDKITRGGADDFGYIETWAILLGQYFRSDGGIPSDPVEREYWKQTQWLWRKTFPVQFAAFCRTNHNLPTKFLFLRSMILRQARRQYWMESPASFVCGLIDPGKFGVVHGPPGKGKTMTAALLTQHLAQLFEEHQLLREAGKVKQSQLSLVIKGLRARQADTHLPGFEGSFEEEDEEEAALTRALTATNLANAKVFRIVTNAQFDTNHPLSKYYVPGYRLSEVHIALAQIDLEGGFGLWFIDEYGKASGKAATREKRWLEGAVRTVRKNSSATLYCTQAYNDLPPMMRDWIETDIQKVSPTRALFTVADVYHRSQISGIPMPAISVNSKGFGSFTVDINEERLAAHIGDVERDTPLDNPAEANRIIKQAIIDWCRDPRNRLEKPIVYDPDEERTDDRERDRDEE
jgi:hypothetical protein